MQQNYLKPLTIILVITSLLTVLIYSITSHTEDSRTNYEKYLRAKFEQLPGLNNKDEALLAKPDRPDFASFQDYINTIDPALGYVPDSRLYNAYKQISTLKNPELYTWTEQIGNVGGRSRAVMFDPNEDNNIAAWAGSVTGGLWYTSETLHGQNWIPVNDFWPSLSISCLTYDPNNTQVFYAGTGEGETAVLRYRSSSGIGIGIWKSIDGGTSWNLLESTSGFKYVTDIDIRKENGQSVIYASVISGLYEGEYQFSEPNDGLYKSVDNGESWTQVLPNIPETSTPYSPSDVVIAGNNGRIFVGTTPNTDGLGGATILTSDDGINWTVFDDYKNLIENNSEYYLPGRVVLAAAPSDSSVVYAAIASGKPNGHLSFDQYYGNYIIKTEDSGNTWIEKNIPIDGNNWAYIAWHAMTIAVHPTDANTLFVGALNVHRSTDGGNSWEKISLWYNYNPQEDYLPGYVHADVHTILFDPNTNEALISTDGGIFYSLDLLADEPDFYERSLQYNTLQYYACAIHPENGKNYFLAAAQDNGTFKYDNDEISLNDQVTGGDGAYCFIDEDEPNIQMTQSQFNTVYISTDGEFSYLSDYVDSDFGIFINPCDYDSKLNTMYANGADFYGNYIDNLVRIKNIGSGSYVEKIVLNTGTNVPYSHIKVSPFSPEGTTTLFIGTQSGKVFKIENAQGTPELVDLTSEDFPTASVSSIDIGQTENNLIATFSNFGVNSVWVSNNGGQTWQSKEGNLPDIPVRWVIFQPDNDRIAMLATELGILVCDDLYAEEPNWEINNKNLANVRVDMLKIRKSDNTVVAATHGRGLFTTTFNDLTPDAGIASIVSPEPNQTLTNNERVEISVKNYGLSEIQGIHVILTLNDELIGNEQIINNLLGDSTFNYTFSSTIDLSEPKIYELKVWTEIDGDQHPDNDTLIAIFDNTSLSEELGLNNFTVYPNPVKDQLNISFISLQRSNISIKLVDAQGKEVFHEKINNFTGHYNKHLKIKSKPGIHFLQINNANKTITQKLIVQ